MANNYYTDNNLIFYYKSRQDYSEQNIPIVESQLKQHLQNQDFLSYKIYLKYFFRLKLYYIDIPFDYKKNLNYYEKYKQNIFSKGKILSFYRCTRHNKKFDPNNFKFDAVVFYVEYDLSYAYIIPIRKSLWENLNGNYNIKERAGEITYYRMLDAINYFSEEKNERLSSVVADKILGRNVNPNREDNELNKIINYKRFFINYLGGFLNISTRQNKSIKGIFQFTMSTVLVRNNTDLKVLGFLVNAIFQRRKDINDKILIASSSNASADKIAMILIEMDEFLKRKSKMSLLRIYAKNLEQVKRNKKLEEISFHYLRKQKAKFEEEYFFGYNEEDYYFEKGKEIIDNANIVISTCVNSYNENLIDYNFPYVIVIDAKTADENESLIPLTMGARFVSLVSYDNDKDRYNNKDNCLYDRMEQLFPYSHFEL